MPVDKYVTCFRKFPAMRHPRWLSADLSILRLTPKSFYISSTYTEKSSDWTMRALTRNGNDIFVHNWCGGASGSPFVKRFERLFSFLF
jgi:hypothetical protein